MKSEFLLAFNQICSERSLPPEVVLDALRTALVSAYRRNVSISSGQNVTADVDQDSGQAVIYVEKEAVDVVQNDDTEVQLEIARQVDDKAQLGDTVMIENTPDDFGRIAAQTAKQVILQRIREAEREVLYEDYAGREGEIINGVVQSVTPQHISINLGRTEAVLPRKEQVPGERYTLHQRLRAYVVEVKRSGRGPQIIVSRSHKNMLRRLLELEVPEIYNGAVEIKAIAREAGARSKVAVSARQPGVDPVGSCVGMRGVRIQSIVNELGGEKIDVIEWSSDPLAFIAKSLSPARVLTVHLEESPQEGRTAAVIVPDDQLSLAIGRAGQNARLAAKLTGWRIDIKSITEAAREMLARVADQQMQAELGNLTKLFPVVATLLEQSRVHQSYNTEQLLLLKQVVDGIHNYFAAKRILEREALSDQTDQRRVTLDKDAQRRAEREKALAQIPADAYDIALESVGLSSRVHNHLAKAQIENLGQIMERMLEGDEGLLVLDGIGPKALAEIKAQVEVMTPAPTEEPEEVEAVVEAEPEAILEAEPETPLEEIPVAQEDVVEEKAEVEVETEAEAEVEAEDKAEEALRRAARERALAQIPADAYDIPIQVLALSTQILNHLMQAQIENLGQVMECLVDGDDVLLALEGIDTKAVADIKSQVEIMVSVPEEDTQAGARSEEALQEGRARPPRPRYEFVADDELEQKTKPKRQRKKRARELVYNEDVGEVVARRRQGKLDFDEWEEIND
jgi:N utilization substance protein A